jgi:GNAT superfamily N-acetyltransferase
MTIRDTLRPGDLGEIVRMHGAIYAREQGFDVTFEAYVAGPLAECVLAARARDRVFLAERDGRIAGSVAIVGASEAEAQLRWYLVDPAARGLGIGSALLRRAIDFARSCGYRSIFLWTVRSLEAAARLYRGFGFAKVETKPGRRWGVDVVEERYELRL